VFVVKLVSQTNWTLGHQRREGGLTGAEEEGGVLARLSSRKRERGGRSWCEENWSSGGPFYRRPGRGEERWRALATLAAAAMMAHSGGDGMARADGGDGMARGRRKVPIRLVGE
jgi:hypothetical protein